MNSWYVMAGYVTILVLFSVLSIVSFVLLIINRKELKKRMFCFIVNVVFLTFIIIFICSHSTYYKFNDWIILRSNIYQVQSKYGEFDLGRIKEGQKGCVGYYIYTDNGPIMPDYLKHYYYIEYDEYGEIYDVYDAGQPGG